VKSSQVSQPPGFSVSSRAVWACFSWLAATVTSTLAPKAKRPLPVAVNTHTSILNIWIADGSTLALFRKLESLQDAPQGKLAGKLCTVIDLLTRLPVQVWFHTNAHDTNFLADLLNFTCLDLVDSRPWVLRLWIFVRLIAKQVDFITRIKSMQRLKLSEFWVPTTRSETVWFASNRWQNQPLLRLRLVEVRQKTMYGYITSVLDPQVLPPYAVADLYGRRWRIEEAFNTAKRLLGLSYLWTGSINGVKLKFGQLGCSTRFWLT